MLDSSSDIRPRAYRFGPCLADKSDGRGCIHGAKEIGESRGIEFVSSIEQHHVGN
jgi:hypothetical protein